MINTPVSYDVGMLVFLLVRVKYACTVFVLFVFGTIAIENLFTYNVSCVFNDNYVFVCVCV